MTTPERTRLTTVRLTTRPWVRHGGTLPDWNPTTDVHEYAGQPIRVHLPPQRPRQFQCGTEWLWRVFAEDVLAIHGTLPPSGHVCVCEHQIDID